MLGWELESQPGRCASLSYFKVGGITAKAEQANSVASDLGLVDLGRLKMETLSGARQSWLEYLSVQFHVKGEKFLLKDLCSKTFTFNLSCR